MSYWYKYKVKIDDFEDTIYIKVYNLTDLLDDKNEEFKVNNSFGSWRELFYPILSHIKTAEWGYRSRGYLSRWIARNICNAFFECLTEDLIEQKITYRLPYKYLARLSVREMDIFDKKSLRLYRTDLVVMMHKGARRRTGGILYHAKFTDRWRRILEEKIDNRERYSKIETDGKSKSI